MNYNRKLSCGLTLVEAATAMALLAIVVLGAMGYQYYAALHARIARAQIAATRTAQLLLEDWKSTGGDTAYDPSTLGLGFSSSTAVPANFSGATGLGSPLNNGVYKVTVDGLPMVVMLTWADVSGDAQLRQLAVIVNFGEISGGKITNSTKWLGTIRPVILTTYVRQDESSG
jgi:hypothetical protein